MFLKEIRLLSGNIAALKTFYGEVLELPVTHTHKRSISITAGRSDLIFEEINDDSNPFYHLAFNVPSNNFTEAFEWIQKRSELLWLEDYKSYIADFVNWRAKSVYFLDPSGNILELIARFDLDDQADELFSSGQIRNVSEIGLVFSEENLDKNMNELLSKYNLRYFPKQPPLKHFRAIGDDEGLFIAVIANRNWFSTEMPSGIFPLEVTFINNHDLHELKM